MYSYSQILKQAFRVAWHNPVLWFFGLFAAILGSAGEVELIFGGFQFSPDSALVSFWEGLIQGGFFTSQGVQGFMGLLVVSPLSLFFITFIFLVVLAATILVVWLVIVSQTALISQSVSVSRKNPANFRAGFSMGIQKFFPVFGINLVVRAFGLILLALTGLLALVSFPGSIFLFILIFDIFLIALILFSFIAKFAVCGVVLRQLNFSQALSYGYVMFKKHWLVTLEVAVVLFTTYVLVNMVAVYVISQIFIYSVITFGEFSFVLTIIFGLLLLIFLFVQALLAIFHWAAWTIIFELLNSPKQVLISKLKTVFHRG